MSLAPDALHFGLERAVEAVVIDFLILHEGILGNELAETLCINEMIFHSILLVSPWRTRCCTDGKLELRVKGEQVIYYGAFAGSGRSGENNYFTFHLSRLFLAKLVNLRTF